MIHLLDIGSALQWGNTLDIVYGCADSDVSIPWNVTIGTGERITQVEWFFQSSHGSIKIAEFSNGQFQSTHNVPGKVWHQMGLIFVIFV